MVKRDGPSVPWVGLGSGRSNCGRDGGRGESCYRSVNYHGSETSLGGGLKDFFIFTPIPGEMI